MRRKKTWREKLADIKDFPWGEPITEKMSKAWGEGNRRHSGYRGSRCTHKEGSEGKANDDQS